MENIFGNGFKLYVYEILGKIKLYTANDSLLLTLTKFVNNSTFFQMFSLRYKNLCPALQMVLNLDP